MALVWLLIEVMFVFLYYQLPAVSEDIDVEPGKPQLAQACVLTHAIAVLHGTYVHECSNVYKDPILVCVCKQWIL